MINKPEQPKRIVVYPQDIQVLTGKSLKSCRNLLTKLRKDMGRRAGDPITYRDFCSYFKWDEELVKGVLLVSYGFVLVLGLYLWIFRDDMDLAVTWGIVYVAFKFLGKETWEILKEGLIKIRRR